MNVLVAYTSRLGSTKAIAERLVVRLKTNDIQATGHDLQVPIDPGPYNAFVIGSAVYAGHWMDGASQFARDHAAVLSRWPVWLFSSGPLGRPDGSHSNLPAEIPGLETALRANDHRVFAGSFTRDAIDGAGFGVGERFIARRFVPQGDFRDWAEIDAWADEIAHTLAGRISDQVYAR